jgi:hypothetical protein
MRNRILYNFINIPNAYLNIFIMQSISDVPKRNLRYFIFNYRSPIKAFQEPSSRRFNIY